MMPLTLVAAFLLQPDAPGPPEVWYHQALGCAAAVGLTFEAEEKLDGDLFAEAMVWGMILSEAGPKAGRTAEQVDDSDGVGALAFFRRIRAERPDAFKAHLDYCRALSRKK
jgi:hypothetical protein